MADSSADADPIVESLRILLSVSVTSAVIQKL